MIDFNFIELEQVLDFTYPIYAHIKKEGPQKHETLQEHTKLCEKYYANMYKERKLGLFFEKFIDMFLAEKEILGRKLYHEMKDNVIIFHDTGKINPEFQRKLLGKKIGKRTAIDGVVGSEHSMLSAVIYLNYYMERIMEQEIEKQVKRILRGICLMNAYIISRHHSNLGNMEAFVVQFDKRGYGNIIMESLKANDGFILAPIFKKHENYERFWKSFKRNLGKDKGIGIFCYIRYLYSILVSSDYYAVSEYASGMRIQEYGRFQNKGSFVAAYDNSDLPKFARQHARQNMQSPFDLVEANEINLLRNEIFLEAEASMNKNLASDIYFLEAPTGSGKSNVSMNLSFQLLKRDYEKIYYIYPFNTLVEQNLIGLKEVFGENSEEFKKIAVINSNTPIKREIKKEAGQDEIAESYRKALLDRQFLNYPFILTTHVSFFQILFGIEKEAVFGFSQLQNSVLILDEIQSYKNTIWSEIIIFLKEIAKLLQMKIIIMSATLPNLSYLTDDSSSAVQLLQRRKEYFENRLFKERVKIYYDLLAEEMFLERLKEHVLQKSSPNKKVVVAFIKKKRAYEFINLLEEEAQVPLCLITGDDNRADRMKKLQDVKDCDGVILVATQVIEAGVDIDMDIGYKDISKLDSEEQFLGRINRSCKRNGEVYFFDLDNAKMIYKDGDYRLNTQLTLVERDMQIILENKEFDRYYNEIMRYLYQDRNCSRNEQQNLEDFFENKVNSLCFPDIADRMKLIEESDWNMPVYISRIIEMGEEKLDGRELWYSYKELLENQEMEYSKKQVKLSEVKSKMNNFIYQIKKSSKLPFNDRIGEILHLENGEKYFTEGRLNREMLENDGGLFLE